jgi:hypothetical protein
MRIVSFQIVGHLALQVGFEDGAVLEVRFEPGRMHGRAMALNDPETFARARLRDGTVAWECGFAIDAQVARVRADEGGTWLPLAW